MDDHMHHEELIQGLRKQLEPILEPSAQGVYVYLDDNHKFCNGKFAHMLGYASPEEWKAVTGNFPELFVDEGSRAALINAFKNAMEGAVGSTLSVSWKKKTGEQAASSVILVPFAYEGHMFALHFVTV